MSIMSAKMPARSVVLQRSELAVPATSQKFFAKAAAGPADAIFLDLEDAVVPSRRNEARENAVKALHEVDWGNKLMSVRVNALGTRWSLEDIIAVARCPRLDMILLPKVEGPDDIRFMDRLLSGLELSMERPSPVRLQVLIETTKGLANVEAIAAAASRLEAMAFGVGDYSIDLENFDTVFGQPSPAYAMLTSDGAARHLNDQWHFALARIANACRAYGIRPIDGPYANYGDIPGYLNACERSRALGFEGKWAIHPSQVESANATYSPQPTQVAWARDLMQRMNNAEAEGSGALGHEGVLLDQAHVRLAEKILARAALIQKDTSQ